MFYLNDTLVVSTRYDMMKFFNMNVDVIDPLDSFYGENLPKLPEAGEYTITKEVMRPDLLSYNLYGSTQYWWILLWYNHILSINDLTSGVVIKYPTLSNIEELYVQASTFKKANVS